MTNQAQELPPTIASVQSVLALSDFGITLNPDDSFTISKDHPICILTLRSIVQQWCNWRGLNCVPKRNSFGRYEASIIKVSPINGLPRTLCKFAHESEGEAAYRAILLWEQMNANGEFNIGEERPANTNTNGALLNEHGQHINQQDGRPSGE